MQSRGLLDRGHRVLTTLFVTYAAAATVAAGCVMLPLPWVLEARRSGVASPALGALLLGMTGLAAVWMMSRARRTHIGPASASDGRFNRLWAVARVPRVSGAGRIAQGVVVPALAALAAVVCWMLRAPSFEPAFDPAVATALGAVLASLFFPALVAERFAAALPPVSVPEAPALRRLLAAPVLVFPLAGALEVLRGAGYAWPGALLFAMTAVLCLLAAELAARGLGRWFQPRTDPLQARAAVTSLLADLPAWASRPSAYPEPLRAHFGLDFSRSWALGFVRSAALPALLATVLGCWTLSGVTALRLDQRGVYERLGEPVAVFGPGLHLTLPWPLGRVRPVEFGAVHAASLADVALPPPGASQAEAPPPIQADRLWDEPHPGEADWLIAGDGAAGQSFKVISADIRVLYRVGLNDADALHALYGVADGDSLVRAVGSRAVFGFFAAHSLDSVLDQRHEQMTAELQDAVSAALRRDQSGLEVVSVVVEAVHPPIGAAASYHFVQAAEIVANTGIATETGRAKASGSLAREQSWGLLDQARARGAETVAAADADQRRFAGDVAARAAGGRAFVLERYLQIVSAALAKSPLTVLDHRLTPSMAPTIDLRPFAAAAKTTGADDTD